MLGKLLRLSEDGVIGYTEGQLLEMSDEEHKQIYAKYVKGECDQISKQFAAVVVMGLGSVSRNTKLSQDLIRNRLFMDDLGSVLSWVVPKLPYVGLAAGGVAIASAICGYWYTPEWTETEETEESEQ